MKEHEHSNSLVHFEHSDVNVRVLALIGAAIVVTAVVLHVALYFLYSGFRSGYGESGRVQKTEEQTVQPRSGPKLQVDPLAEIGQFRAEENRKLNTYGWINKDKGVVRIPIDLAMKLIAERGLPNSSVSKPPITDANSDQQLRAKNK